MNQIIFDYHYEEEAERYTFIRLPKALYTEDMFRKLSDGSKVLYGMLLELMGLSRKNGWIDEKGRVYISVSIQKIRQMMNCGNEKAVAMLRELDSKDGVGLIERIKQGQGKPTIIYVKSFIIMKQHEEESREIKPAEEEKHEFGETENKNSEKPKTRIRENRILEFGRPENKNSEKPNLIRIILITLRLPRLRLIRQIHTILAVINLSIRVKESSVHRQGIFQETKRLIGWIVSERTERSLWRISAMRNW